MTSLWRRIFAERRSVLVPLLALLVIDAALVGAAVFPLKRVVASDTKAAEAAHFNTALATQRLIQMKNARASRVRAEQELTKFYGQVLPTGQAHAGRVLLVEVDKLAKENNLSVGARSQNDEEVKDTDLQVATTKVELVGDYAAILRFIYDVETSEQFLSIRTVQLSQASQQRAASGHLQVTLEIATYYRNPARK